LYSREAYGALSQKVSKIQKNYCIHSSLPKNAKSRFGFLGPLGVNLIFNANSTRVRLDSVILNLMMNHECNRPSLLPFVKSINDSTNTNDTTRVKTCTYLMK
jgi:hypothetical protein